MLMHLQHPVLIIPGMASSALEVWESPIKEWGRTLLWIDPLKFGNLAVFERTKKALTEVRTRRDSWVGGEMLLGCLRRLVGCTREKLEGEREE